MSSGGETPKRASQMPPEDVCFVVIDVQDKLVATMDGDDMAGVERNIKNMLELARLAGIKTITTEQYPKGLGSTITSIAEALSKIDGPRFEKTDFSAAGCEPFRQALRSAGCSRVVLTGMEAHVCVLMTALDLVEEGYEVLVPHDAVISRDPRNRAVALDHLREEGAVVTSTESVLFRVLGRSGGDTFKAISRLLR